MPQLDVLTFPSQIFWLIVCFTILCFVMVTVILPRLSRLMATRAEELGALHHKADQFVLEANQLNRNNADQLKAAKLDRHTKVTQVMTELAKFKDETVHTIETRIHEQISEVHHKLDQNKQVILDSSSDLVNHLVAEMYQNLTGEKVDPAHLTPSVKGS
jgi:F-type H+-transporting ATPase subunit b